MDKHVTYCDFLVRGEGLAIMDFSGKSDPYIVIKVPTKIMMKRNIFEFENDILISASPSIFDRTGASSSSPFRLPFISPSPSVPSKNAQGTLTYHIDAARAVDEHTNALKAYPHTEGYKVVYESEVVKANLNPLWQPFRIGLYELCKGNTDVELLIECWDWDRFKNNDFIGSGKVRVQDLLETVDEYKLQLISKKGEEFGMLNIKCTPSVMDLAYCDFRAFGVDLAKKSLRGSTDPYFVIKTPIGINERRSIHGDVAPPITKMKCGIRNHPATEGYREIYESPVIKNTIAPDWGVFQLGFYDMCRTNPETKLLFECYDYNDILKNRLIGTAEISVQSMIDTRGKFAITLMDKKRKKETETGKICLQCKPSNLGSKLRKT